MKIFTEQKKTKHKINLTNQFQQDQDKSCLEKQKY